MGYPDLEDNGLSTEYLKNFRELVGAYENMTDEEILENANLYEGDLWKPAGKYIAGIDFAVLPGTVMVVLEDGRSTTLRAETDENGKLQFELTNSNFRLMKPFYHAKLLRMVENETIDEDGSKKRVTIQMPSTTGW